MRVLWPFAGIALSTIAYAFYEPYRIDVTRIDVPFANLPIEFDGFTILHLSDLHTTKYGYLEKKAESMISSLNYDICVITGDLSTSQKAIPYIRRMLVSAEMNHPVYVVPGNSEYKPWSDTELILQACEEQGFIVLRNSSVEVVINNDSLTLVGLDDAYSKIHDVCAAFSTVRDNAFVIALSHCPSVADELIAHGGSLILSGHTHGGQVRVPGIGVLWSHMRRNHKLNDGYYSPTQLSNYLGIDANESKLYVNRGLGTSRIHMRLNCRPEIALLKLCRL